MARRQERNNYQDKAEVQEYDKGFAAGSNKNSRRASNNKRSRTTTSTKSSNKRQAQRGYSNRAVSTASALTDANILKPNEYLFSDVTVGPTMFRSGKPINLDMPIPDTSFLVKSLGVANDLLSKQYSESMFVPGIMRLNVLPTLGQSTTLQNSGINLAGAAITTAMRSKNSRLANYDYAMVIFTLLSSISISSAYYWARRTYGLLRSWNYYNSYDARAILTSMDIDYQATAKDIANFRERLNTIAGLINTLYIPDCMGLGKRWNSLFQDVYRDANTAKGQLIYLQPIGFYKWIEGNTADPLTHLDLISPFTQTQETPDSNPRPLTVDDICDFLMDLIDPLLRGRSQDYTTVMADFENAFGDSPRTTVPMIEEAFTIQPVQDMNFMSVVENAYIGPAIAKNTKELRVQILQYTGNVNDVGVYSQVACEVYEQSFADEIYRTKIHPTPPGSTVTELEPQNYVLNYHTDSISPEQILTASRWTLKPTYSIDGKRTLNGAVLDRIRISTPQTEIILGAELYFYDRKNSEHMQNFGLTSQMPFYSNGNPRVEAYQLMLRNQILASFDWHPRVDYVWFFDGDDPETAKKIGIANGLYDLDNYLEVPRASLEKMANTALLGLYQPQLSGLF